MTSNLNWRDATGPTDIIPSVHQSEKSAEMLHLISQFTLTQGDCAGQRFGDAMLPWQRNLYASMFSDGIREVGLKCGKGSGKTVMLSALALAIVMYYAGKKKHYRSSVILLSANIDTANISFNHILEAINIDPHLEPLFKVHLAKREITHKASGITIKITPPSIGNAVGRRCVALLVDEVFVAAQENKDFAAVVDQLRKGGGNFGEDFLHFSITTAPTARSEGYYTQWLAKMRAVRDGKIADSAVLPCLYEFPHDSTTIEVDDPEQWWRGMPSLRTDMNPLGTMDAAQLQRELDEAVQDAELTGGNSLELLLSQRLGIEPDERKGGGLTPLAESWNKNVIAALPVIDINDGSSMLAVGYDPSSGLSDPFAITLLTRSGENYYIESRQFLAQDGYDKAPERIRMIYDAAISCGELSLHKDAIELESAVFAFTADRASQPYHGQVIRGGDAAGLAGFKERFEARFSDYEAVAQGWTLMASFERAAALSSAGKLQHTGQPLLAENIRNLTVKNGRLHKLDGNLSGVGWAKIDGAMAALSSLALLSTAPTWDASSMCA